MSEMIQPLAAVLLVLGLLAGTLFLLRRRGIASFPDVRSPFARAASAPAQLAVLERLSLTGQHTLHLVRVGERRIVVATAPGVCRILDSTESGAAR